MKNRPIILFDGVCNVCNYSVQFIIKNEKNNNYLFSSLQSKFGQKLLKDNDLNCENYNSIILFKDGNLFFKSKAVLKISKNLKFPYSMLQMFFIIPNFIRDFCYDLIAKNRYIVFGKKDTCFIPSKELSERFV